MDENIHTRETTELGLKKSAETQRYNVDELLESLALKRDQLYAAITAYTEKHTVYTEKQKQPNNGRYAPPPQPTIYDLYLKIDTFRACSQQLTKLIVPYSAMLTPESGPDDAVKYWAVSMIDTGFKNLCQEHIRLQSRDDEASSDQQQEIVVKLQDQFRIIMHGEKEALAVKSLSRDYFSQIKTIETEVEGRNDEIFTFGMSAPKYNEWLVQAMKQVACLKLIGQKEVELPPSMADSKNWDLVGALELTLVLADRMQVARRSDGSPAPKLADAETDPDFIKILNQHGNPTYKFLSAAPPKNSALRSGTGEVYLAGFLEAVMKHLPAPAPK